MKTGLFHMYQEPGLKMWKLMGRGMLACVWKVRWWLLVKRDEAQQRKADWISRGFAREEIVWIETEVSAEQSRPGSQGPVKKKKVGRVPGQGQGQNPEIANYLGIHAVSRKTTPASNYRDKSAPRLKWTLLLQKPQKQRERKTSAEQVQSSSGGRESGWNRRILLQLEFSYCIQTSAERLPEYALASFSQGRGAKWGAS